MSHSPCGSPSENEYITETCPRCDKSWRRYFTIGRNYVPYCSKCKAYLREAELVGCTDHIPKYRIGQEVSIPNMHYMPAVIIEYNDGEYNMGYLVQTEIFESYYVTEQGLEPNPHNFIFHSPACRGGYICLNCGLSFYQGHIKIEQCPKYKKIFKPLQEKIVKSVLCGRLEKEG